MADDMVENILKELELDSHIENFKANKITVKNLKILTEEMIKDLIPSIGDRATFLDYWRNKIKENQPKGDNLNQETLEAEECGAAASKNTNITISMINNVFGKESQKSIIAVLNNTPNGKNLISVFTTADEQIRKSHRGKLCDAIIDDLQSRSIQLTNELAAEIAIDINKAFPLENLKTWYVAPIRKKDSASKKSQPSKGKLMSKWRNVTSASRALKKKVLKEAETLNSPDETVSESVEIDDIIKETVVWLKENQAPWNTVLENWVKTTSIRIKQIKELKDSNLVTLFDEWRLYKHPQGYELIQSDFNYMKLSSVRLNFQLWNEFYNVLNQVSSLNVKDGTANTLSTTLTSESVTCDSKVAASLLLLSHFYPPRQMKSNSKGRFKPSIGLSKDSMLQIAKVAGDITKIRSKVISEATELKIHVQPYILVLGLVENIQEVYVIVDDVMYKVNDIVESIDVCFKAFHVFDLKYPAASEHIWLLIQKGIYKFDLSTDPEITSIQPVLSHLIKNRTSE